MKALMVYGYSKRDKAQTGRTTIECIFSMLLPTPSCIARAKRTAEENGYEITRVELNASYDKPFRDVTEQFMKGKIEE